LDEGIYFGAQEITLTAYMNINSMSPDTGAIIWYSLSNDYFISSKTYQKSIIIYRTTTLKFFSIDQAGNMEPVINEKRYKILQVPDEDIVVYPSYCNIQDSDIVRIVINKNTSGAGIIIYNIAGQIVYEYEQKKYNKGDFVEWRLTGKDNSKIASGLYIIHIKGNDIDAKTSFMGYK